MDSEVKTKWCEALRSGKYEQGMNVLRSGNNKFCCLGVLGDIVCPNEWKPFVGENDTTLRYTIAAWDCYLPGHYAYKVGLTDGNQTTLSKMNDQESKNFKEIADWIEENL